MVQNAVFDVLFCSLSDFGDRTRFVINSPGDYSKNNIFRQNSQQTGPEKVPSRCWLFTLLTAFCAPFDKGKKCPKLFACMLAITRTEQIAPQIAQKTYFWVKKNSVFFVSLGPPGRPKMRVDRGSGRPFLVPQAPLFFFNNHLCHVL